MKAGPNWQGIYNKTGPGQLMAIVQLNFRSVP